MPRRPASAIPRPGRRYAAARYRRQRVERVAGRRAGAWRQGVAATDERERVGGEPEQGHRQQVRGDRRSQQRDGDGGREPQSRSTGARPSTRSTAHHDGEQGGPAEGTKPPRPGVQDAFHGAMVAAPGAPPWTGPPHIGVGKHLPKCRPTIFAPGMRPLSRQPMCPQTGTARTASACRIRGTALRCKAYFAHTDRPFCAPGSRCPASARPAGPGPGPRSSRSARTASSPVTRRIAWVLCRHG